MLLFYIYVLFRPPYRLEAGRQSAPDSRQPPALPTAPLPARPLKTALRSRELNRKRLFLTSSKRLPLFFPFFPRATSAFPSPLLPPPTTSRHRPRRHTDSRQLCPRKVRLDKRVWVGAPVRRFGARAKNRPASLAAAGRQPTVVEEASRVVHQATTTCAYWSAVDGSRRCYCLLLPFVFITSICGSA